MPNHCSVVNMAGVVNPFPTGCTNQCHAFFNKRKIASFCSCESFDKTSKPNKEPCWLFCLSLWHIMCATVQVAFVTHLVLSWPGPKTCQKVKTHCFQCSACNCLGKSANEFAPSCSSFLCSCVSFKMIQLAKNIGAVLVVHRQKTWWASWLLQPQWFKESLATHCFLAHNQS